MAPKPWYKVETRTHPATDNKTIKKVSKDSGAYKDSDAINEYVALLHTLSSRRGCIRVAVLVLALILISVGLVMVSIPWESVTSSEPYDPDVGLNLSIAGCDLRLVPGDAATVDVEARRDVPSALWHRDSAGVVAGVGLVILLVQGRIVVFFGVFGKK